MEEIMQVHVVKTTVDYSQKAKEAALGAGIVLVIGTILPAVAKFTAERVQKKAAERRQRKQDSAETN